MGFMYVWDAVNDKWVKLACDADGKIKAITS